MTDHSREHGLPVLLAAMQLDGSSSTARCGARGTCTVTSTLLPYGSVDVALMLYGTHVKNVTWPGGNQVMGVL